MNSKFWATWMAVVCWGVACDGGPGDDATTEGAGALTLATTPPAPGTVQLPACTGTPEENRRMIQTAIDQTPIGGVLILPPGTCVVARCGDAQGTTCPGVDGVAHRSALYVGGKSTMTIMGSPLGLSVLALDPNPPRVNGMHGYCGPAHLLTIHRSSFVTLQSFMLDGSNGLLPQDDTQCLKDVKHDGRLNEHLHAIRVLEASDIYVQQMRVTGAYGDAINLMGEQPDPATGTRPTERVTIRNVDLFSNRRSGIAFQHDVGHVTFSDSTIRDTEHGLDISMEPSGDTNDVSLYDVTFSNNLIERSRPTLSVSLGSDGTLTAQDIFFVNNVIRPNPNLTPLLSEGGCVQVYAADRVTITGNTIVGASGCATVAAERATNVTITNNTFVGYANLADSNGNFAPTAVVDVHERRVAQPTCATAKTCIFVYYPDHLTVNGNTIFQHLPLSPGIRASNSDGASITGNRIVASVDRTPASPVTTLPPSAAIELVLGVPTLTNGGVYLNERTRFKAQMVRSNRMASFSDGLRLGTLKAGVTLDSAALDGNRIDGPKTGARGIVLGPPATPAPFVTALEVSANLFGCGFAAAPPAPLPPNAFVVPAGQASSGNVGSLIPCGAP